MKHSADAILRTEQADYLEALNGTSVAALAAMAGVTPVHGRDPLLAKMEARAAERGYPISDPEVACFLAIVARISRPKLVVELGTNIGYGAIVMARGGGRGSARRDGRVPPGAGRGGARVHRAGGARAAHRGAPGPRGGGAREDRGAHRHALRRLREGGVHAVPRRSRRRSSPSAASSWRTTCSGAATSRANRRPTARRRGRRRSGRSTWRS